LRRVKLGSFPDLATKPNGFGADLLQGSVRKAFLYTGATSPGRYKSVYGFNLLWYNSIAPLVDEGEKSVCRGFQNMLTAKRKLQILLAIATLMSLALAVGCRGFFRDPQLNSITVGPQNATIQQGSTLQMSAVGNFDDGSTNTLSSGVFWSSDDTSVAPISAAGVVTGAVPGTANITASSGAITGTTTITVALNNVTAITIAPTSRTILQGQSTTYTVSAAVSGGPPVDITASVSWTVTNTSTGQVEPTITVVQGTTPVTVTTTSATPVTTYTITATYLANSQTFTSAGTLIVQ
jgi:hypothetical protein